MAGGHNIPESHMSLFATGGRHRCLWPEATRLYKSHIPVTAGTSGQTMLSNWIICALSDHLLIHVRNFATGDGHSLLWLEATAFLSHRGDYSRPEADTVACGRRLQGLIGHKSRFPLGQMVTLMFPYHLHFIEITQCYLNT